MTRHTTSILRHALMVITLTAAGWGGVAMAAPMADGRSGPQGDAVMAPFGGRGLDRMLDVVEASAEQRSQIAQIAAQTRAELAPDREAGRALHEQALALFAQPSLDATAAEALRQQQLARHDRRSQRMLQAMLEIGAVLTPDQRRQWADVMLAQRDARGRPPHARRGGGQRPEPVTR